MSNRHDDILLIEEGCELLHCVHATPAIIDAILSSFLKIIILDSQNGTELCPDGNENEAGGDEDDDDRAPNSRKGALRLRESKSQVQ